MGWLKYVYIVKHVVKSMYKCIYLLFVANWKSQAKLSSLLELPGIEGIASSYIEMTSALSAVCWLFNFVM